MRTLQPILTAALVALLVLVSGPLPASAATEYYGRWFVLPDDDEDGTLGMMLEDSATKKGLALAKTERYCAEPGVSYAEINRVLTSNGDENSPVTWKIVNECRDDDTFENFARICVSNKYGEEACSTYIKDDWYDDFESILNAE